MTRKELLLKLLPNASLDPDGLPKVCAMYVGFETPNNCVNRKCKECWNTEVKERKRGIFF